MSLLRLLISPLSPLGAPDADGLVHLSKEALAAAAGLRERSFPSEAEFRRWAEEKGAPDSYSWLIVLPASSGMARVNEALSWIKRHPKIHFACVVVIAPGLTQAVAHELVRGGVWAVASEPDSLEKLGNRLREYQVDVEELAHLERLFAEELGERLLELREALRDLNPRSAARIYRSLHAIKGAAHTLQFPSLATFLHEAESMVESLQATADYDSPESVRLIEGISDFLQTQHKKIENRELLAPDFPELGTRIKEYVESAKARPAASSKARSLRPARVNAEVRAFTPAQEDELGNIAAQLGSVLATGSELQQLCRNLGSEFQEEAFPKQLEALATRMKEGVAEALAAVDSLQSVPLIRMKSYLERAVAETAIRLGKSAQFVMDVDPAIVVDPRSFSALRRVCMHMARNAVDHGLEIPADRLARGKPERGSVTFKATNIRGGAVAVTFEDDGAGIDLDALRAFFRKLGGAAFAAVEKLPEKQLLQLIFSESFSSRTQLSEISGRGIGLADVRQQLLELGGMIDVSSEREKGTRFTIILPRNLKR